MAKSPLAHVPFVRVVVAKSPSQSSKEVLIVPPKRNGPGARTLGLDHKEVRDARRYLDMTQATFALELGIPVPTLVSYECGRTLKVPEEILERIRSLVQANGEILPWKKRFDGVPVKEILRQWAERLGTDPEDMVSMAAMTGTTVSTISRWRSGEVVPRLRQLIAYDHIVEANVKRLHKSGNMIKSMIVVSPST